MLIEQYRHGTEEVSLEIPGGMVDPGEGPRDGGRARVDGGDGLRGAARSLFLGKTRPNPAIQDNWIHTFLARDVEYRHEPSNAGTEQTRRAPRPARTNPGAHRRREITHSLVVVGFHWLGLHERGIVNAT